MVLLQHYSTDTLALVLITYYDEFWRRAILHGLSTTLTIIGPKSTIVTETVNVLV